MTWTPSCPGDVRSLGVGRGWGKGQVSNGASGCETLGFYSEMRYKQRFLNSAGPGGRENNSES